MDNVLVRAYRSLLAVAFVLLAACSGGGASSPPKISIGGTVSGLNGSGLVLTNNGGDALSISGNGLFVFPILVATGSLYSVAVQTQPSSPNQTCQVTQVSGTAGNTNVTTVSVTCIDVFAIGGNATGVGYVGPVTLTDSAGDAITLTSDGPFQFTPVPGGTAYSVSTVGAVGFTCSIGNGSGVVVNADITNITFTCPPPPVYTGEVTVSGLTGSGLVFSVEGGGMFAVSQNGTFPFPPGTDGRAPLFVASLPSNPNELCTISASSVVPETNVLYDYPVSCSPYVYTLGGTVTGLKGSGLSLNYISYNGAISSNVTDSAAVGANGAFAFSLPLASAETYSVSVAVQPSSPTQNCIVRNADGTMPATNVNSLNVICSAPRFAYGASGHGNAVFAYTVDADTGALTAIAGSPYPAGDSTSALAIDPGTHFLFAANLGATGGHGSNTISAYTIDAATGALTAVPGSPFPCAAAPIDLSVEPSGRYLYVATLNDNTVSAFSIDPASGALTPVAGGPVVAGLVGPRKLAVHPSGEYIYLAAANESSIWAYTLDENAGALTPVTGNPVFAALPTALIPDPAGANLYSLTHYYTQGYAAYGIINAATGAVGMVGSAGQAAGTSPNTLAMEPGGHFFYMTSLSANGAGMLNYFTTPIANFTRASYSANYNVPTVLTSSAADPSGKFLYVVNSNGDALAFVIDSATGALTPAAVTPSAFAPGQPILLTNQ